MYNTAGFEPIGSVFFFCLYIKKKMKGGGGGGRRWLGFCYCSKIRKVISSEARKFFLFWLL